MKILSGYAGKRDDGIYSLPFLTVIRRRQMTAWKLRWAYLFVCVFVFGASLAVAQGIYTQIDFPSALMTQPNGINSAGQIVGSYEDDTGGHGFLLQNGTYTTIDYPGAQYSYAQGINDNGQIVGLAEPLGYVYDMSTQSFTPIQYPGALYTYSVAINNAGTIAGYFTKSNLRYQGFELVGSDYTEPVLPGSVATFVNGISTAGTLVGYADIRNLYSNFQFRQDKTQTITIPDVTAPFVLGTNPAGTALVGYYQALTGVVGFVCRNKVVQTLSFPGAITTVVSGINAKGEVVGYFLDSHVVEHGFVWTASAGVATSQHK
jgi:probable HAF family extracellular repeat protein